MPKQLRENADVLDRYEWVYGRSMGSRDEVLQRIRHQAGMGMEAAFEYPPAGELGTSSSTGLLSTATLQLTPDAASAAEQGRRASLLFENANGRVSLDFPR